MLKGKWCIVKFDFTVDMVNYVHQTGVARLHEELPILRVGLELIHGFLWASLIGILHHRGQLELGCSGCGKLNLEQLWGGFVLMI
jgi:hypothetical protein